MKVLKIFILVLLSGGVQLSCNKSNSATTGSSTMSANVNGSTVTFSASFTNSGGVTVLQGSNNLYTITIYAQISGPASYMITGPPSYPYATISNISGTFTTTSTNLGQLNISAGSSAGLYNGNFYFTAYNPSTSAGSITVSNGLFTNM